MNVNSRLYLSGNETSINWPRILLNLRTTLGLLHLAVTKSCKNIQVTKCHFFQFKVLCVDLNKIICYSINTSIYEMGFLLYVDLNTDFEK